MRRCIMRKKMIEVESKIFNVIAACQKAREGELRSAAGDLLVSLEERLHEMTKEICELTEFGELKEEK